MSDPTGPRWPTIPEPGTDPLSMLQAVARLKESMELLTGQRGFDETYSVDNNFRTMQKRFEGAYQVLTATFSERIELAVNEFGALAERTTVLEVRADATDGSLNDINDELTAVHGDIVTMDARIVDVDTASIGRDGALATSIDIVQARVNDVSAGGYFKTVAAVSGGALASMEAQVYTTSALNVTITAGWRVKIEAGVSYFDVYSANWRLIDTAGTPKKVMEYSAGKFRFTGDVAINGNLVVIGTIDNPQLANLGVTYQKIYPNSATQGSWAVGSSAPPTVTMSLRGSAQVAIFLNIEAFSFPTIGSQQNSMQLLINGNLVRNWVMGYHTVFSGGIDGSGDLIVSGYYMDPNAGLYLYTVPADGVYTFKISTPVNILTEANVPKQILVIELAR